MTSALTVWRTYGEKPGVVWTGRYAGLACEVKINGSNALMRLDPYAMLPWFCGYVTVPADNPAASLAYEEVDVEVHGGLTYDEKVYLTPAFPLDGLEPTPTWGTYFGFDTNHSLPFTLEAAIRETKELAAQLAALHPKWARNGTEEALQAALERYHLCNPHLRGPEAIGI